MSFNFNKSGKFIGFGFGYPTFVYKKSAFKNSDISESKRIYSIDSIFNTRVLRSAPKNFNGCLLISKNDKVYYKNCSGYANFESRQPLNDSSLFLLASCSKHFTAMAIMILHADKKLELSDNVTKYLPSFPYENINIENLLTHTSGLPDYFPLIEKHSDKSKFVTNQDVLKLIIELKPKLRFTPNTVFEYSNTGYVLLSLIIEKASGLTYKEYIESRIFAPLNMRHSLVYNRRRSQDSLPNYALGYSYSNQHNQFLLPDSIKQKQYVRYMDGITGDDGISSTILDLDLWIKGFQNNTLVSSESQNLMTSSHLLQNRKKTNYGFGLMARKGDGLEKIISHTGSWPGYSTMIMNLPERIEHIIILANTDYDDLTFLADEIIYTLLQ